MRVHVVAPLHVVVAIALGAACAPTRVPVDFSLPKTDPLGEAFLATPWPSDLMLTGGGLDLGKVPNPFGSQALEGVIGLFKTSPAYSATGTLYFHVEGGIDESSLPPDPASSRVDGASMFLVAEDGVTKIPLSWKNSRPALRFSPPARLPSSRCSVRSRRDASRLSSHRTRAR